MRVLRLQRGLTQEQLARLLDIKQVYISQAERGMRGKTLDLLAAFFEVDAETLIAPAPLTAFALPPSPAEEPPK